MQQSAHGPCRTKGGNQNRPAQPALVSVISTDRRARPPPPATKIFAYDEYLKILSEGTEPL